MGSAEQFTTEEKEKLLQFREAVKDLLNTDEKKEDGYLIRWLRARSLDVGKAEEMFRLSMKWREDNKMDTILDRVKIPEELFKKSPMAFLGISDDGYGVFLMPWGRHDMRAMLEEYGVEKCQEFNMYYMEYLTDLIKKEGEKVGKKVTQFIEICDMEGYSYRQMANKMCRDFMATMQLSMDANYPEILAYACLVNAPKIFAVIFQMMKPFISKQTLEKIDIHGPDKEKWMKIVRSKFPVDKVPKHWGGNLETTDEYASGHEIWIQGPENLKAIMTGLDEADSDFEKVAIPAREKFIKEIDVAEQGTILEWKYKTDKHDVGFQLHIRYKRLNPLCEDIIPYQRVEAQDQVQEGSHICAEKGVYVFTFDNSFSKMTGKTLLYQINVVTLAEQELQYSDLDFKDCVDD